MDGPRLQKDGPSSPSYYSSPESRPVDLRIPIPEEGEGDEMSSDATNEPITPIESHHPLLFQEKPHVPKTHDVTLIYPSTPTRAATPPLPAENDKTLVGQQLPGIQRRATAHDGPSVKRGLSGMFKRTTSHSGSGNSTLQSKTPTKSRVFGSGLSDNNGSDPGLSTEHRRLPIGRLPGTTSDLTTRSSPASPGSPVDGGKNHPPVPMPTSESFANGRKKNRSSSGLGLRERLIKHKITFSPHETVPKPEHRRNRATSVDLEGTPPETQQVDSLVQLPSRQVWGMAADTGTGLKSRRLSMSLPDTFAVDEVELYSEFCDQSKIIRRRGKTIGKGATAHVKLMNRKGGAPTETYAVKEFRGKSTKEKSEDYEQKVKSEYSIAKSTHHPNIVESFRLCTHNGRWNHVMEFCDQGDLFHLVSQKYLSREDHLTDRLCLFKQLIQGLNYLHTHGIAHRDIKLENLLITRHSKLKITDFGVSEVFAGIHPGLRSSGGQCGKDMGDVRLCPPGMCGSPPYVAPEVIAKTEEYDPRPLDVWGAAIVMLCMTANGVLWNEAKAGSSPLYDDLLRGWTKWNSKHTVEGAGITETDYPYVAFFDQHINPPALRRILLTMLNPEPSKRASISTVAKNRWIKKVECCQIDSHDGPKTSIDASRASTKTITKVVHHNHLPPSSHLGHKLVRLPGSTDM
ncbi:kinase-like domain-containing protein [Rhexocercosporidium sp. MPI-PUGE-AT-0058]|nr:kinase-like domain-containing protein [Rhexocercosporidium sp. MPI-PUGE-AT-0058]